jgi:hypothetical protein
MAAAASAATDQAVERALANLPELAERLADLPQRAIRRLYDALDLQVRYHPKDRTLDIELTLTAAIGSIGVLAVDHQLPVQVCSVPPVGFEPTLSEV